MARRFIGIFLLSAAALLLQVTLTRVLSVSLWYHFGFLVISTALLGFGASGSLLSVWTGLRERYPLDRAMSLITLGFAVSAVVCFRLMQSVPFEPFNALTDRMQLVWTPAYLLLIGAPFFWAGLGIGLLLTRGKEAVNRLYAWDLAGAGLGCIAVVLVIPFFGGSGSVVVAAAVAALASLVFALPAHPGAAAVAGLLAIGFGLAAPTAEAWLPITLTANKTSRGAVPLHSEWDAFSKIDVLERPADPAKGTPTSRTFRIDGGTAFTGSPDPKKWIAALDRGEAISQPPSFRGLGPSFVGKRQPSVLVIGSGAGAETLEALLRGAGHVTALEINPIIARIARDDPFWCGLFTRPNVDLYAEEGRSFVQRSGTTYDLIVSVHTISNAAMAAGAMSLAENYVLTREAFDDYLEHLAPDGTIYFTRPEAQLPRLFATARAALEARGVTDPSRHLYAWRDRPEEGGGAFTAAFVMRKTPFSDAELAAMDAEVLRDSEAPGDRQLLYSPARGPEVPNEGGLAYATGTELAIYRDLLTARDPVAIWEASPMQLAPATDDQPFFNHRTRWSSLDLATLGDVFRQEGRARMALEDRPVAEVTLLVMLVESAAIALVLILLPLWRFHATGLRSQGAGRWMAYFAMLGVGYILVEIVLIQRFTLFLGQPVLTFAIVLAGLLVSSGVGALLSERLAERDPRRGLRLVLPLLLLGLLAMGFGGRAAVGWALGWSLPARIGMTLALIAPLGILMGMPFPLGMRALQQSGTALLPWSWGVNGFFTVIGSVLAVMLGMTIGFTGALVVAGVCYAVAFATLALGAAPPTVGASPSCPGTGG